MSFSNKKFDSLGKLALRLNGMFWKGRTLCLLDDDRLSIGRGSDPGRMRLAA